MADLNECKVTGMNQEQIEKSLKSAIDTLTPDIWKKLDYEAALLERKNKILSLEDRMHSVRKKICIAVSAAACISIVSISGGIYNWQSNQIVATIGIDVNPSLELYVNRKDKIIKYEAVNGDAEPIIAGVDLKGKDIESGLDLVVESMMDHGYLEEDDSAILLSVENSKNDEQTASEHLYQKTKSALAKSLNSRQAQAVIFDQKVTVTEDLVQKAEEYQVSVGKAAFIQQIVDANVSLSEDDFEGLSYMNMKEMAEQIKDEQLVLTVEPEEDVADFSEDESDEEETEEPEEAVILAENTETVPGYVEVITPSEYETAAVLADAQMEIETIAETNASKTDQSLEETIASETLDSLLMADHVLEETTEDDNETEPAREIETSVMVATPSNAEEEEEEIVHDKATSSNAYYPRSTPSDASPSDADHFGPDDDWTDEDYMDGPAEDMDIIFEIINDLKPVFD